MENEIKTAEDFKKLKTEIREYLENKVKPLIHLNYTSYIDAFPILLDVRQAMLKSDKEMLMNSFIKLRKKIEYYEMVEKN